MKVSNKEDIPLSLAVWLMHDNYDYQDKPNYISATTLMKPIKQIVLGTRVEQSQKDIPDLDDFIPRALGNSIHDAIERSWTEGHKRALSKLGYPESLIERVLINPKPEDITPDSLPIFLEQRKFKKIEGFTLGGKYDMVTEGIVQDHKSTSAWSWVFGTRDEDFILQGSIYRFLDPEVITEDFMQVNFVFTDWQKSMAASRPDYPSCRVKTKRLELLTPKATEKWIRDKLKMVTQFKDATEAELPECTDEELWRSETEYKYFKNPTAARATKNFKDLAEANNYMANEGKGVGMIKVIPGEPKRCAYCPAFPICEQRKRMLPDN